MTIHPVRPRRRGPALLVLILLLVNSAAIWGQAGWALDHIVPPGWSFRAALALALGFAAALELIGVFLAMMADQAEADDQPAGGIRLGSYAQGLVSGALNASHWGWWTAAAAAFGLLSSISPFLWGVYSRVRRGRPIAPSRRFWHPVRSVTLIRFMAWHGIVREADGIAAMAGRDPAPAPQPAPEVHPVMPPQPVEPEHVQPGHPATPKPQPPEDVPRRPQGVHERGGQTLRGEALRLDAIAQVRERRLSNAELAALYTPPLGRRTAEAFGAAARRQPQRINGNVPALVTEGGSR